MILAYETTQEKYTCSHCGRRFRTFAAYQRHSSARLSAGTCQQAVQRPARSPPRERPGQTGEEEHFLDKAGRAVQETWQGVGTGIKDGARGLADGLSNFFARDRPPQGMITTNCPHCFRHLQVPAAGVEYGRSFSCIYCSGAFTVNRGVF